tara:strand:+ start:478 stop:942 length:465 start_codon:yes stop_codon:yes gene_type:complete
MPTTALLNYSKKWLTVAEVVKLTGYGKQPIINRIKLGSLPARKDDKGRWQIARHEVVKLLDRCTEPMYSCVEAAALLSFSDRTIAVKLRQGGFPNAVMVWGEWRIPESDLLDIMREGTAEAELEVQAAKAGVTEELEDAESATPEGSDFELAAA